MRKPYELYERPIIMPDGGKYYIDEGPPIGAGGYSLIYSAHSADEKNKNRFVIKEFFPNEGAKRNEEGIVVPTSTLQENLFKEKLQLFNCEGILGEEAGNISCQIINFLSNGNGYALMKHVSDDTCTVLELVKSWAKKPPKSPSMEYKDLGRVRYALLIIRSLLSLLKALHEKNILHLDLCPGNLFWGGQEVEKGEGNMAFLADFGCAAKADENNQCVFDGRPSHVNGGFSAPELVRKKDEKILVSSQTDLFSCTALLLFLCLGDKVTDYSLDSPEWKMESYCTMLSDYEKMIKRKCNKLSIPHEIKYKLADLIICGCQEMPEKRYKTAKAMQEDVQNILDEIDQNQAINKTLESIHTYVVKPHTLDAGTYVARNKELNRIDAILQKSSSEKRYCIVQGIGGAGKTELAKSHAWEKREHYKKVFFLTYKESSEEDVDLLSLLIKSDDYIIPEKYKEERRIAEELFLSLDDRALIIIDNCTTITNQLLHEIKEKTGNAKVIITTRARSEYLNVDSEKVLEIGNDEQKEFAFQVFYKNYYKNRDFYRINVEDEAMITDISRMAMYNPLILSMLAIQCREYELSLRELRKRMTISLENAELDGVQIMHNGKEGTISDLMEIYFSDILRYDFTLYQKTILTVLCMMPAEQIKAEFLYELLGDVPSQSMNIKCAAGELSRLNWIQKTGGEYLSIHPLLAEVLLSYGETQLIPIEELSDFCNDLLQNWLCMDEITQKEEIFLPYVFWKEIKEEDRYLKTNLMMSAVLDKTQVEFYWSKMPESKQHPNVVLYANKWEDGSAYGILDIQTKEPIVCLDLKERRNKAKEKRKRHWRNNSCIEAEKHKEGYTILLYLHLVNKRHLRLPNEIAGSKILIIDDEFAKNNKNIKSVKFPMFLEKIGSWAFSDSSISGKLMLPESVKEIGKFAYNECKNLRGNIIIPSKIKKIYEYTFSECIKITQINFPSGLMEIGTAAFGLCLKLSRLKFPENLQKIGHSAFYCCDGLKFELELPESLRYIGDEAFAGCGFTGDLRFPEQLEHLGRAAFEGCYHITGNLKVNSKLRHIKEFTFSDCGFTGELVIPEGIKIIDECAFSYCDKITSVILPDSLECMGDQAFFGCNMLKRAIKVPANIRQWGDKVFNRCDVMEPINLSIVSKLLNNKQNEEWYNEDFRTYYVNGKQFVSRSIGQVFDDSLNVRADITRIEPDEFINNTKLRGQITFEKSCLESIGDNAFTGCTGLYGTLRLPQSLRKLGDSAFCACINLNGQLILPEQLKVIESYTFSNTGFMSIKFPSQLECIGLGAFNDCFNLRGELHIPQKTRIIKMEAFAGCRKLEGILIIPNSVECIEANAFHGCGFTKIVFMNKYTKISRPIIGDEFGCNTIIVGKRNSTAHEYAQRFNCTFEPYNGNYDF